MLRLWLSHLVIVLALMAVPVTVMHGSALHAQSEDDDDEDDGDDDDDDDVPDPDDGGGDNGSDPDNGDAPDDDPGDEADGGDPDDGDAGPGGGDDDAGGANGEGGDDDGAGSGASDDVGDDGDGGTGNASGDDDDDDAPGGAPGGGNGNDDDDGDDDAAGDDDDGGKPAPSGGGSGDDDDDDGADRGDDGVDPGAGPESVIDGGDEGDDDRIALDARDGVEVDKDGFRYRRNEFVALDLKQSDIEELQAQGFRIIETARLDAIGATISLIQSSAKRSDNDALAEIEDMVESSAVSFNYLFDTSSARIQKASKTAVRKRYACGCDIGLIDTGVASKFSHVQLQQKAFNGKTVVPKTHGTGIVHLFAGTQKGTAKRATRIFVADIFGSDRANAGSSFVLVKALDWMGQMKVPVINVSLAGPKSSAVAKAVEGLTRKGHIVVAAAGNDGPAAPAVFPGAYPGVVAVTAVDSQAKIYRYANRGNYIDLSAVGVKVPAIDVSGTAIVATGTSFASPTVAVKLAKAMTKPDAAAAKAAIASVEKSARDLGTPGRDTVYGHGLVSE